MNGNALKRALNRKRLPGSAGINSGFTMIELMVSSAILLVAIAAVSTQYISQVRQESNLNQNLQAKTVMDSVISAIGSSPQSFPPLKSGGNNLTYVACLNNDGTTLTDYKAMYLSSSILPAPAPSMTCAGASPSTCYCGWSGIEVHLTYSSGLYLMDVSIFRFAKTADGTPTQTLESRQILVNPQLSAPVKGVIVVCNPYCA